MVKKNILFKRLIDHKKIKKINIDKYLRSTLTENFRPEILVGNNSFVLKNE